MSQLSNKETSSVFWKLLKKHPTEFWLVYVLEFFIEIPFTLIIAGSTIYNIDILGFTEIQAGIIFAFLGLAVGFFALAFSNFPARYGMKIGLYIGNILGLATNVLLFVFRDKYFQVGIMFLFFIPSISLNFISLKLAVKQYTYPETRSFGYSMFYMVFFIASGISSALIDFILSYFGIQILGFLYLFISNSFFYAIAFSITYFLEDIDLESSEENILEKNKALRQSGWEYTKEVIITKKFWKFFSLVLLLSVVKSMYFHLSATLPQYMYRDIEKGAHFGYMMAGHQLVLILATPSCTYLVYYFTSYTLLVIGSFITAFSVLIFVFGSNYYTIAVFVVVISFGEAIYSPRLIDYTLAVAPKGKEAVYIGIANIPNFLSLLITGISSGILLHFCCPKEGTKDCKVMWFWIGGYSFIACSILVVFKNLFEQETDRKNPNAID